MVAWIAAILLFKVDAETPVRSCAEMNDFIRPEYRLKHLIICKATDIGVQPALVLEIVRRESGFKPEICNRTFGCSSGQGLMQIIPSTHNYCEAKLGRELDMFKAEDNLDCGLWLLKNEGIRHWAPYSGPYKSGGAGASGSW